MSGSLKEYLGARICSLIPLGLWHRYTGIELVLPYWHVVANQKLKHVSGLYEFRTIRQFKADIDFFLEHYTPITLQAVIDYLDGKGKLPARCFLPTFDDGFREIYEVIAPVLFAKGVPAVFFLISTAVDNRTLCYPQKKSLLLCALSALCGSSTEKKAAEILTQAGVRGESVSAQIRSIHFHRRKLLDELGPILGCDFSAYAAEVRPFLTSTQTEALIKQGFSIGSHSVDHPLYSELSLAEQLQQTEDCSNWLSSRFHFKCESFAFPYSDTGVEPKFFSQAFANDRLKVSFGTSGIGRHFYPRHLPRFTMERTNLPAAQIIARQFGRTLTHR